MPSAEGNRGDTAGSGSGNPASTDPSSAPGTNRSAGSFREQPVTRMESEMRSLLLWVIGVPLPIILILWLVTGHP